MTYFLSAKHPVSFRRDDAEPRTYRFGRRRERHGRGLSALHHANGYLRAFIQSVADTKFRRMLREFELRDTHLDLPDELWTPDAVREREGSKSGK